MSVVSQTELRAMLRGWIDDRAFCARWSAELASISSIEQAAGALAGRTLEVELHAGTALIDGSPYAMLFVRRRGALLATATADGRRARELGGFEEWLRWETIDHHQPVWMPFASCVREALALLDRFDREKRETPPT